GFGYAFHSGPRHISSAHFCTKRVGPRYHGEMTNDEFQMPEEILGVRHPVLGMFQGWTRGPGPVCLFEDVLVGFTSDRGVSGELRARRARALVCRRLERATGVRERTTRRPPLARLVHAGGRAAT